MTLVLEVTHPDGVRSRHQLGSAPLTLGRGVANDVILDDPYVDATHARLTLDGDGVVVEDLGSVNGLLARGERIFGRLVAHPGDILRIGRTTLRFRDHSESLPPALVDRAEAAPVLRPGRRLATLATTTAGGLVIATLGAFVFGVDAWLDSASRAGASEALSAVLGYVVIVAMWAGLWSVASRITLDRFRFVGHLAVVSALALVGLCLSAIESWLTFFFPDSALVSALSVISIFAIVGILVAAHLALASTMTRRRRWRAGGIFAGSLLAITALVSFTKDDSFSDVPKFAAVVKPVAPSLIPTKSIDQFEGLAQDLKKQVDQLATK